MPFPPSKKTFEGLIQDITIRLTLVERRLAIRGGGSSGSEVPVRGTPAARDARYGVPATDAERAELANKVPLWFNTVARRSETYYAVSGSPGLTVPGLVAGSTAGWYATPAQEWAGKSGPTAFVSPYIATWARGTSAPGSTLDGTIYPSGILIRMEGQYECHAFLRGGPSGNASYIGLGLNGDRAAFEARSNPTGGAPMVGVWTHDHPAANNNFSQSHYIGRLYAGDIITAGPGTSGMDIQFASSASSGALWVRRIS